MKLSNTDLDNLGKSSSDNGQLYIDNMQNLKRLINSQLNGIFLIDPASCEVMLVNHVALSMTGLCENDIIGSISDNFVRPFREYTSLPFTNSNNKGVICFEGLLKSRVQEDKHILIQFTPVKTKDYEFLMISFNLLSLASQNCSNHNLDVMDSSFDSMSSYPMSTLLNSCNDAVVIIQDGILKFVNTLSSEAIGIPAYQMINQDFLQFVSPEHRQLARTRYDDQLKERGLQLSRCEISLVKSNGQKLPVELNSCQILYENRPADLVFIRDLSDSLEAKKDLKRRVEIEYAISSITSNFMYSEELDPMIEEAFRIIGELCGCSRVYLFVLDKERAKLKNTHEWCAQGVKSQIENLQALPVDTFPWWMKNLYDNKIIHIKDVSSMPEEANAEKDILLLQDIRSLICLPVHIERQMIGFIGMDNVVHTGEWTSQDIEVLRMLGDVVGIAIERKQKEDALKKYADELSIANRKLQTSDSIKEEFLGNLTHEFRTPLNVIKGFSKLIHDGRLGNLSERQKKAMKAIMRNNKRLEELVESLLYMTSVQANNANYTFVTLDMIRLLERVIFSFSISIKNKRLNFETDIDDLVCHIRGDIVYLEKVFYHLLDNAIKFTDSGGKIILSAYEEDDFVHISFKDTGVGIPAEQIPYVFLKFYQLDGSLTRRYGGNGIGLYISKRVIDAHNGYIWLESEFHKGTTVHLKLPVHK